jgi:rhamnose transport system ATP-binding protein
MNTPILELSNVSKAFGGARALVNGTMQLHAAQVTALLGENGAGKSTLVKILSGVYQPDAGEIRIDGRAVRIASPHHAQTLGISVIHQESVVFDDLSVAENMFITALPMRRCVLDWRGMRQRAAAILSQLGAPLDPRAPLRQLSAAQKHLVQIARALCHDARIVIMDEPTASLSQSEADDLLGIVGRLRADGRSVLYISHRFEEVFAAADRYCVFRDGAAVGCGLVRQINRDELVRLMVGRTLDEVFPKIRADIKAEALRVENLARRFEFADISFSVRSGEILGIYGLIGAGRSELLRSLFGLAPPDTGRVLLGGEEVNFKHPDDAIRAGLALVPEDRQAQGAILSRSIVENIVLPSLSRFGRSGFSTSRTQSAAAIEWVERLHIKCDRVSQPVQQLSGGNQQKLVIAKWLLTAPRVLMLDEPTKGVDVGAKAALHALIGDLAAAGMAIIMVSSDLPEVLAAADRILVMRGGRICATFARGAANSEDILRAAAAA